MADINISNLPAIVAATNDDMLVINDANSVTSIISWQDLTESISALTGQISFAPGSELLPSIIFDGDPNTGIYQPQGDTVAISTGGDTRLYIASNGSVGIGNEDPSNFNSGANNLVIGSATEQDTGLTLVTTATGDNIINFADGIGQAAAVGQLIYSHDNNRFSVHTSGSEAFRVTSTQDVYIGAVSGDQTSRLVVGGGSVTIDNGSPSTPALNFRADLDTGITRPGEDQLAVVTGGEQRLVVDETGRLGLGTAAPAADIHVNKADATLIVTDSDATGAPQFKVVAADGNLEVRVDDNDVANDSRMSLYVDGSELTRLASTGEVIIPSSVVFNEAADDVNDPYARVGRGNDGELLLEADPSNLHADSSVRIKIDGADAFELTETGDVMLLADGKIEFDSDLDTFINHPSADTIRITTGGNTAVTAEADSSVTFGALGKIDQTNSKVLFGSTTPYPVAGLTHEFQLTGNALNHGAHFAMFGAGTAGQHVSFLKSAGDGVTPVAVTNGDQLGAVQFAGDNGVDYSSVGASITSVVDGTVSASSMPAAVVISTTPGNSVAPVERVRVAPSGALGLGGSNYGSAGQVILSGGSGTTPSWADLPLFDISTLTDLP